MITYAEQKRILDIIVALGLLVLFLPIWIIVPILISIDSPGPIIFVHKRVGKYGKPIYLYKFRSMVKDADELLHSKNSELLKQFKAGDWKLEHDPRITKVGRILRSLTIDEFPQLFNVLKGEMSIVGPRPYVEKELKEQQEKYPQTKPLVKEIMTVKPGITGLWQTSGRNEVPFVERVRLDVAYVKKQSIWNDVYILLKTPKAMLSKW
ncbi:galactosyl-1-phosphate transferase [Candidatus Cerribacteria bacterium 'Amazon FNV 2010 28 9']|uniref:Galactosyl-1-phosphate transferase n=1 Tax=Candidatus Cerribacteria bacterium 'Amazon FNV 2010 28 9' TaxID=2081795 RepID=A0A317JTV4_9BACT|nr:MAG: galactosyl-1-phosphate transferase [Candidatus Cerribacteria bacterium 'Amazon FNV 2010 28 9']